MGMSSSQARLLSLTARMHDIEYRAQRLEAQKLQLANESDKAYADYLRVLDAKKIQYKTLSTEGSVVFKDANMNVLQNGVIAGYNGENSSLKLFLQTQDGKIMVTPAVAAAYHLSDTSSVNPDMDAYVHEVTGKNKSVRQVIIGHQNSDMVESVSPIATSFVKGYNLNPTYIYLPNSENEDSIDYTEFQNPTVSVHPQDTSSLTELSSATVTAGASKTYKISTVASLQKLATLGSATQGNTFILAGDIDMTGKGINASSTTWSGIAGFAGTFDGNGYEIQNLGQGSATATNGLFASTSGTTTIKNVKLTNVNINGTTIGGIVAHHDGGTISNCVVTGKINATNHSGGIIGENNSGRTTNVENCSVDINMTATTGMCYGGIEGHGEGTSNIINCFATGSINAPYSGGLIGHNSGATTVKDCVTTVEMKGTTQTGLVIGWGSNSGFTFTNVAYKEQSDYTIAGDNSAYSNASGAFVTLVDTPSINTSDYSGGFFSNIYGALIKNADGNPDAVDKNAVTQYIANLYNSTGSDIKIANINNYVCKYLKGEDTGNFIDDLKADVETNSISLTTSNYQDIYNSTNNRVTIPATGSTWDPFENIQKGEYRIPAVQTMAEEVYYILNQKGKTAGLTMQNVKDWFNNKYSTTNVDDKQYLANINDMISAKDTDDIYSAIVNGTKLTPTTNYDTMKYDITFSSYVEPAVKWVQEDVYGDEYYWDTTDTAISNAISIWTLAQKGVIVVKDTQASSYEYLRNMLETGYAVLTTFEPAKASELATMTDEEIINMSEAKYNELLGIENTSVSTETFVQEVQDEAGLRKAEAKYEADMRKIDRKDRMYDTELAALDNERNAIKSEMETLKTVAKDNVERTFKLFG